MGLLAEDFSADDLRRVIAQKPELQEQGFTAAQAATIILDGVRSGAWRILVGEEAKLLDEQVRANPEAPFSYENYAEMYCPLIAQARAEASGTPEPSPQRAERAEVHRGWQAIVICSITLGAGRRTCVVPGLHPGLSARRAPAGY